MHGQVVAAGTKCPVTELLDLQPARQETQRHLPGRAAFGWQVQQAPVRAVYIACKTLCTCETQLSPTW